MTVSILLSERKENAEQHYFDETAHLHGNIGVTRADEMVRSTMELYEDIDVYNLIAHMFEKEFLVQVY